MIAHGGVHPPRRNTARCYRVRASHSSRALEAEWGLSDNNRRAKYYALTERGRAQLRSQTESWQRFARAVFLALDAPG